jgi:hypothetical protein
MFKKVLAILLSLSIITALTIVLLKSSVFQKNKINSSQPQLTNISWLPNGNSCENAVGLMGRRVLINYISNPNDSSVYIYDPQSKKEELIAKYGGYSGKYNGYTKISPYILSDQKLLLHYNFIDNMVLQYELNNLNGAKGDYSYSTIEEAIPADNWLKKLAIESAEDYESKDKDTKSKIVIYDLKAKREETIFEYKSRYRSVGEGKLAPINSFQSVGYSNNSKFICWCVEYDLGVFHFSVYNLSSKAVKKYKVIEKQGYFNFINNLSVSNDGKTLWFTGCPINNYCADSPQAGNNIFKLDLTKSNVSPELISENVVNYKTSFDNRYLVYEKLSTNGENMLSLNCLDLDSMNEVTIDEDIMPNLSEGFDLSDSDNTFSYLKKDSEGVKVYVGKLGSTNAQTKLIYKLPEIKAVNCMHMGKGNRNILIFFDSAEKQHRTCIININ